MRVCSVECCDRQQKANGYCGQHDRRSKLGMEMDTPIGRVRGKCTVEGCESLHAARGYCRGHLKRLQVHGDPLAHKPIRPMARHDHVTCQVAHNNVKRLRGSASEYLCDCGAPARDWAYNNEDPDGLYGPGSGKRSKDTYVFYSTDPRFYNPMCGPCHSRRDGALRAAELKEYRTLKHKTGLTYEEMAEKLGVLNG